MDLILPPSDVETLMVKRVIAPDVNTVPAIESLISPVEMEITGLRVKIACLEKTSTALKLELKCAQLQLESKEKLDKQKSRLLELLEAKVADLEKKNNSLIGMLEGCISEKQVRNNKMIEASNSMERLALRLQESDKMKRELKAHNDELKSMLSSVESKGSAIAKIAKEKLIKYKDENIRMQGELDDYKQKEESPANDLEWKKLSDLGVQVQDQLTTAKFSEKPEITAQSLSAIDQLNNEIQSIIFQVKETTELSLQKYHLSNDKLQCHVANLKKNITELEDMSKATLAHEAPNSIQLIQLKTAIESLAKLGELLVE